MESIYFIGLGVPQKTIAYCIKTRKQSLVPHALELKISPSKMLKAITPAKKKKGRAAADPVGTAPQIKNRMSQICLS